MCGINGIIGDLATESNIRFMNDAISHRGPDADGSWIRDGLALGHRRLSIIDLDPRSNQPFVKGRYVLVYNGEIYNFREVKQKLSGVEFRTESDTEVILEAWNRWGIDCLQHFRGMFAFAIYDTEKNETWLVRDHFGIKPIFFYRGKRSILFSSELKAIETLAVRDLTVNRTAVYASLFYLWIPERFCIWDQVEKVKPGQAVRVSADRRIERIQYWSPESLIRVNKPTEEGRDPDPIEAFGAVIESSVKRHLVADVPVNTFLSGGIDSSLVTAIASRHTSDLESFTIEFSARDKKHEAMSDDAFYASLVADHLGIRLNRIVADPDIVDLLPKVVHHLDEPIGDPAAINTFLICDRAYKNGTKVLLSGMGADEILCGYRKHYANTLLERYQHIPSTIRKNIINRIVNALPVSSKSRGFKTIRWAKKFVSFSDLDERDAFFRSYTYSSADDLRSNAVGNATADIQNILDDHHAWFDKGRAAGLEDAMCFTDLNNFMVSLNLAYTDRSSMAASTEVRVPFIDLDVVKAAFELDAGYKLRGRTQKYILKEYAKRWIPEKVINRPKTGFALPIRSWIKNELAEMVGDYLLSGDGFGSRDILTRDYIDRVVSDEMNGLKDNALLVWQLLTLEQWFRNRKM